MMIRVIDDMDFDEIRRTSWCGAVATANRITEEGKEDEEEEEESGDDE